MIELPSSIKKRNMQCTRNRSNYAILFSFEYFNSSDMSTLMIINHLNQFDQNVLFNEPAHVMILFEVLIFMYFLDYSCMLHYSDLLNFNSQIAQYRRRRGISAKNITIYKGWSGTCDKKTLFTLLIRILKQTNWEHRVRSISIKLTVQNEIFVKATKLSYKSGLDPLNSETFWCRHSCRICYRSLSGFTCKRWSRFWRRPLWWLRCRDLSRLLCGLWCRLKRRHLRRLLCRHLSRLLCRHLSRLRSWLRRRLRCRSWRRFRRWTRRGSNRWFNSAF